MARTLEEILKAKGFGDEDLAGMSTLLKDNRFRGAVEEIDTERETLRNRDREWDELRTGKYEPALRAAEEDARKARIRSAELEESVKIAKEYGYIDDAGDRRAQEAAANAKAELERGRNTGTGFNLDDPKFKEFAGRFSQAEGDSIALHNFVAEEYRSLNGGSINDYRGADGKRGMIALRAEAQAARVPIDQYAATKFNWDAKRQSAETQRKKDYEDSIRKEEREKIMLESGMNLNPNLQRHVSSRQPFIPPASKDAGQPWDRPGVERRSARIQRATETQLKSMVQ